MEVFRQRSSVEYESFTPLNKERPTWASTCQREIEVLPSYPGLNCNVTDRGPMFEMAKFVGGPGSSVSEERKECSSYLVLFNPEYNLAINPN